MSLRNDHFQRMREEEAPQARPEEDAPKFSTEQAAYIRKTFARAPTFGSDSLDSILTANTANAQQAGREEVIRHIETLARG